MNTAATDLQSREWRTIELNIPRVFMLLVFCVVGMVGNTVILLVYGKLTKLSTTQFLIVVIAVFDLLTAFVQLPLNMITKLAWFEILDIYWCRSTFAIREFCLVPSAILLFVVTLVRYCHVCLPQCLRLIEPRIKSICIISVTIGLFYGALEASVAYISETKECKLNTYEPGVIQIAFLSKFSLVITLMILLVFLNIFIIMRNSQNKKEMAKRKNSKVAPSSLQMIKQKDELNSGSLDTFFEIVHEKDNFNTNQYSGNSNDGLKSEDTNFQGNKTNKIVFLPSSAAGFSTTDQSAYSVISENPDKKREDTNFQGNKTNKIVFHPSSAACFSTTEDINTYCVISEQQNKKRGESIHKIIRKIVRKKQKREKTRPNTCSDESSKDSSRTTAMICVVSCVYVLSYLPISIMPYANADTLACWFSDDVIKYIIYPLLDMFYLGCAANPIIYTFVNPGFRSECRSLFPF